MGNCCPCFDSNDSGNSGAFVESPRDRGSYQSGGQGQRLGTKAEYHQEKERRAEEAAARAAVQQEPERRIDPNLTDAERQRQRELRLDAAQRRTAPKRPKAPLSNREFRNPRNDPNTMQWSV